MAFEGLAERLSQTFKKLRGKGKLTEQDVKTAMREIRMTLLEADVNFKVAKAFTNRVAERAVGSEVLESLTPGQQVIKIVNEELIALMGDQVAKIEMASKPPTIVMMAGLQGSGKTTHCAKLAAMFQKQGKRPLMIACDIYRPAAIKQLQVLAEQIGVPVFAQGDQLPAPEIAAAGVAHARKNGNDMVFIDTAGRLHVDEALMAELAEIKKRVGVHETLLVVDAMTGQDAVNVAAEFNEKVGIDGVILTKMDGDTRGGAALSVKYTTGKPIKFVGMGEKLSQIEPFYPDRMASRILGMGDVLSLIEKVEQHVDAKKAAELEARMRKNAFTLEDFLATFDQIRGMGASDLLAMMPGANAGALKNAEIDEKAIGRTEAIILSMTPKERQNPEILNSKRKRRIAAGSGTRVEDVNRLLKQFEAMKKMMKQFGGGKRIGRGRRGLPFSF